MCAAGLVTALKPGTRTRDVIMRFYNPTNTVAHNVTLILSDMLVPPAQFGVFKPPHFVTALERDDAENERRDPYTKINRSKITLTEFRIGNKMMTFSATHALSTISLPVAKPTEGRF